MPFVAEVRPTFVPVLKRPVLGVRRGEPEHPWFGPKPGVIRPIVLEGTPHFLNGL